MILSLHIYICFYVITIYFVHYLQIETLDLDGCPIADLGLDFILPGHANIELCRGGRDTPVTVHNLHQYISLVTYWFLVEGVQKQFEALKEGMINISDHLILHLIGSNILVKWCTIPVVYSSGRIFL